MRYLSILAIALFLSACGGSSSSSSDATDSTDTTDSSDTTETSETTNTAPEANAGVDQSVNTGTTVSLDGSASSDADGDTLTYNWAIITYPVNSAVALDSFTSENPTFTADTDGSYTFELAVSDGSETSTDQVIITASTVDVSGTSSTNGIECAYSYSEFNDSASVNTTSTSDWTCSDTTRDLVANGIPDHEVGTFPNTGNPNTISEQDVSASFTLTPIETDTVTELGGPSGPQGYVLNGVKIDSSTAGSCDDSGDSCSLIDNSGNWSIEALGQDSFDFGTDDNNAHVQPDGAYHYHGMPEGFIELQGGDASKMTLIAWASDGFPIYARYGYSVATDTSSALTNMTGSYQLSTTVSDSRPSTDTYALGTFRQDWEYVEGSGDLDECNGRFGVTPEFPNGIYHYYATDTYPYFQRCVKGEIESAGGPPAGGPPQ
ncbi:hypothetical protein GCM10009133_33840 [Cocleimonas flava]|uniref:YHYH protein n=1 Tax=Cocleimonas flava TaxID=634765 RepID=A0A4R1F4K7_9GAMM|nr:YHYH protein [Cocleimonas flava]TCJ88773.1 YHYH protein [Cocleimonas flava]